MKRNRLAKVVLTVGALHSGLVSALGLGELALDSTLNQPFRAEIPLRDIGELDVEQIRVQLADSTAFENAGVDRSQFLSSLEFKVELLSGGNGRIIVTTAKAVVEPYLDFIVEARWPNGKMIREYTVLLDLPVYADDGASQAVLSISATSPVISQTPVRQSAVPTNAPQRDPGGSIGAVDRAPPVPRDLDKQQELPASDNPNEYRVQNHDTMWRLANKLRPSSYVTTQQTMLALVKKNPQAFVNGNVNQIKSGYILRLPSEAEVKAIDHNQAVEEIKIQAKEWRGDKVARPASSKPTAEKTPAAPSATSGAAPMAPQLDATANSDAPESSDADKTVKFSLGSAGDAASGDNTDAVREKLREEQENLEKTKLENSAMQNRVVEMEKQIQTLQSLIALKNSQLAALQNGQTQPGADLSKVANEASDEGQAPEVAALPVAASDEAEAASEPVKETQNKDAAVDKPSVAKPAEPAKPAAVVTAAQDSQSWVQQNLVAFVGVFLALLALLVLVIRRRKSPDEEADLANFEGGLDEVEQDESPVMFASDGDFDFDSDEKSFDAPQNEDDAEVVFSADDFDFDSMSSSDGAESADDVVVADSSAFDEVAETRDAVVTPQTGDVVAEAEIYVAYGRYDQAASLLNTAIAQDPENSELRLKLIDIYLDTRDQENFESAYRGLLGLNDDAAVARVKESMSAIEGVSHWLGDEQSSVSDNTVNIGRHRAVSDEADGDGDDLDFSLDSVEDAGVMAVDDNEIDFELDDAPIDSPEISEETAALVEADNNAEPLTSADSVADADTDTLESLDVDLADLDFDFEGDFGVESGEQPLDVEGELPPSIVSEASPIESLNEDAPASFDGQIDVSGELSPAFADLSEDEELDFSLDDAHEISSAGNASGDTSLDKIDLDFSLDDAEVSSPVDETDDELISFDDDDIASFELDDAELGAPLVNEDTQTSTEMSDGDDTEVELETIEFASSGLGDTEIGELTALNEEGSAAEELVPEFVDKPTLNPESNDEDELDLDLSDLDMEEFDTLGAASLATTSDADTDEIELDLADFDMPNEIASSDGDVSEVDESEVDESFFVTDEDDATSDEITLDDELFAESGEILDAGSEDKPSEIAEPSVASGEAISVEDLVFDEFDASEDDVEGFDSLIDSESVATKLDLARAYIDMGDSEGAREMLEEVLQEGDIQQQSDAQALLDNIG